MNTLDTLFPDEDHRFHLGLQRSDAAEFFKPQDRAGALLAERRHWLADNFSRYARLLPGHAGLLDEVAALAPAWGAALPATGDQLRNLGESLEPDLLLLSPDEQGDFRLRGGVLCFPTAWALEAKIGQTMDFIHGPVPGLNALLGAQIGQFLARLKPGTACTRQNWGLAAVSDLNLHPALLHPRPALPLVPGRLWLRVEHQIVLALPSGRGVVFGIRIELIPLLAVRTHAAAAAGLRRALISMAQPVADYKGIDAVRLAVADWLAL